MLAIVISGAGILAVGVWLGLRLLRSGAAAGPPTAASASLRSHPNVGFAAAVAPDSTEPGLSAVDVDRIRTVSKQAADRLWKLAFAAPSQNQASELVNRRIRDNIVAKLQVDTLDEKYFPRRPTLMPQLLQAVNDPRAASEKIARIIAHDPVLTAEVLRLANSTLHRAAGPPIETIQRAIVVCGVDALRGMLATAMLQPVFRATRKNFPRLPRMLWERTEHATRAAESYALERHPRDRFESQLVVLLSALGPLVVYSVTLDVYARNPHFSPNGDLCVALIGDLAPQISRHIARNWETSPRLLAALDGDAAEPLTAALHVGELLGSLSLLESQTVISGAERRKVLDSAGLSEESMSRICAA
jgi:HD-like signal output (HDOD) protein